MKATYVRVSTFEQNISRQLRGKEGAVYWDKVSGMVAFGDRENAARLLADAEEGISTKSRCIPSIGWAGMPSARVSPGRGPRVNTTVALMNRACRMLTSLKNIRISWVNLIKERPFTEQLSIPDEVPIPFSG